jgi:hypothetical protein
MIVRLLKSSARKRDTAVSWSSIDGSGQESQTSGFRSYSGACHRLTPMTLFESAVSTATNVRSVEAYMPFFHISSMKLRFELLSGRMEVQNSWLKESKKTSVMVLMSASRAGRMMIVFAIVRFMDGLVDWSGWLWDTSKTIVQDLESWFKELTALSSKQIDASNL